MLGLLRRRLDSLPAILTSRAGPHQGEKVVGDLFVGGARGRVCFGAVASIALTSSFWSAAVRNAAMVFWFCRLPKEEKGQSGVANHRSPKRPWTRQHEQTTP